MKSQVLSSIAGHCASLSPVARFTEAAGPIVSKVTAPDASGFLARRQAVAAAPGDTRPRIGLRAPVPVTTAGGESPLVTTAAASAAAPSAPDPGDVLPSGITFAQMETRRRKGILPCKSDQEWLDAREAAQRDYERRQPQWFIDGFHNWVETVSTFARTRPPVFGQGSPCIFGQSRPADSIAWD